MVLSAALGQSAPASCWGCCIKQPMDFRFPCTRKEVTEATKEV